MEQCGAVGIFKGRLKGVLNGFNSLYSLKVYKSKREIPEEFLFSGSEAIKQLEINVPKYFRRTFLRDAERLAVSRIKSLARRLDCDVVVLENIQINGSNPLNPDFDEKTPQREYKVQASFYSSPDYLNRHLDASLERLKRRRNLRIFQNI